MTYNSLILFLSRQSMPTSTYWEHYIWPNTRWSQCGGNFLFSQWDHAFLNAGWSTLTPKTFMNIEEINRYPLIFNLITHTHLKITYSNILFIMKQFIHIADIPFQLRWTLLTCYHFWRNLSLDSIVHHLYFHRKVWSTSFESCAKLCWR